MVELADARDLKSLGSDTIPVRARSAAPQRWENESVLSSLFFARVSLFGSVYSINEFSRSVDRAGKIFFSNSMKKAARSKGGLFTIDHGGVRAGRPSAPSL